MNWNNVYFINGTAYAGKSTMVKCLAEKYDGIACTENYHEQLMDGLDPDKFPGLCYTRDLQDWHDFIRRSPDEYEAWIDETSKECEILELQILEDLSKQGKKVFVDTNVSLETLRKISDNQHVLIMLANPEISVRRFFERPDREKQFLYQLMLEEPEPKKALENFRECLKRINSEERYDQFLHAGFPVILRDENRTIEETLALAERVFGLVSTEDADYYHVISDLPKKEGEIIRLDEQHPNGVYQRVHAEMETVKDIYAHPENWEGKDFSHTVKVALRELALEKVRKEKYPQYPSRMACLYVSFQIHLLATLVIGIGCLDAVAGSPLVEIGPTVSIVDVILIGIYVVECHQSFIVDRSCPKVAASYSSNICGYGWVAIFFHKVCVRQLCSSQHFCSFMVLSYCSSADKHQRQYDKFFSHYTSCCNYTIY